MQSFKQVTNSFLMILCNKVIKILILTLKLFISIVNVILDLNFLLNAICIQKCNLYIYVNK